MSNSISLISKLLQSIPAKKPLECVAVYIDWEWAHVIVFSTLEKAIEYGSHDGSEWSNKGPDCWVSNNEEIFIVEINSMHGHFGIKNVPYGGY